MNETIKSPIQPKSLEEIMHEWKNEVPPMFVTERDRWLRQALASHLLWAAEGKLPDEITDGPQYHGASTGAYGRGYNKAIADSRDALLALAQKIVHNSPPNMNKN